MGNLRWGLALLFGLVAGATGGSSRIEAGANAIVRDDLGRLWLASESGLRCFDGYRLLEPEALFPRLEWPPEAAAALLLDGAALWVGLENGVATLDLDTGRARPIAAAAGRRVDCLLKDREGRLWMGGPVGLWHLDADGAFREALSEGGGAVSANALAQDRNGVLWIGCDTGLFRFDATADRLTAEPPPFPKVPVYALLEDRAGLLWAGTARGVRAVAQREGLAPGPLAMRALASLEDRVAARLLQDDDGLIWVGGEDGLWVVDLSAGRARRVFPESLGQTITALYADARGGVWWGGRRQTGRIDPLWKLYRPLEEGRGQVKAVCWTGPSRLEVGDAGGLSSMDAITGASARRDSPAAVNALWRDATAGLWLGSDAGLFLAPPQEGQAWPAPTNAPLKAPVRHLAGFADGGLWAAVDDGLLFLDGPSGDLIRAPTEQARQRPLEITALFPGRRLWVGASDGLYEARDKTGPLRRIAHPGLGSRRVLAVRQDESGRVWVGSAAGLHLLDEDAGVFRRIGQEAGLPAAPVTGLAVDGRGRLWLSARTGVYVYDVEARQGRLALPAAAFPDGVFTEGGLSRAKDDFFGAPAKGGLILFHPSEVAAQPPAAPSLTRITLDGAPALINGEPLTLDAGQAVTLYFTAADATPAVNADLAYRLDPLEETWRVTHNGSVTYANLPPGAYRFLATRPDAARAGSSGSPVGQFTIDRPWQRQPLYLAAAGLALLAVAFLLGRARGSKRATDAPGSPLTGLPAMVIAHELNTPLGGIIGISETLLQDRDEPVTPKQRGHVQTILNSARRLVQMTAAMLDFARVSSGRSLTLQPVKLELRPIVEDVLALKRAGVEKGRNIELVNETPAGLHLAADEGRLHQILVNLVDNAAAHTVEGRVAVSAVHLGEMVEVRVRDNGAGVPEPLRQAIFEPYVQGQSLTRRANEGLGLGLSLCRELVALQGGKIRLETGEGKGSSFVFTLPAA